MAKLFGTNGIRGIFGQDFTLEFIHDITLCLAEYFKEGAILVGYDGRDTSPLIAKIICPTLNYAGLDCKNAGLDRNWERNSNNSRNRRLVASTSSSRFLSALYNGIKP